MVKRLTKVSIILIQPLFACRVASSHITWVVCPYTCETNLKSFAHTMAAPDQASCLLTKQGASRIAHEVSTASVEQQCSFQSCNGADHDSAGVQRIQNAEADKSRFEIHLKSFAARRDLDIREKFVAVLFTDFRAFSFHKDWVPCISARSPFRIGSMKKRATSCVSSRHHLIENIMERIFLLLVVMHAMGSLRLSSLGQSPAAMHAAFLRVDGYTEHRP